MLTSAKSADTDMLVDPSPQLDDRSSANEPRIVFTGIGYVDLDDSEPSMADMYLYRP